MTTMKYHIMLAIILILFVHNGFASSVPDAPHIMVTGEAEIQAVPDIMTISLSLTKVGMEVEDAKNDVERRSRALIATLKNLNIEPKDINSAELQITPHYNWNKGDQIYAGTEVTRRINATLRDLSRYDTLIKAIIDAKVANINNTRLTSSKEKQLRKTALQKAIVNAKVKAETVVHHIPQKLGSVYSITPLAAAAAPFPEARYQAAEFSKNSSFEPGIILFKESLQIVFFLINE